MHELSLCYGLLDQVQQVVVERAAQRATRIELRIGPLSGAEPELLKAAFPVAAAGTVAEGAELVMERGVVEVRCGECGATGEVPSNRLLCPACESWRTQVVSGDELLLTSLELELAEE
uniref:Hydrogenase maturation factor HypA n=1 Tax=Magnetococcus massalia (strain MO-1) TaxID=451514 RepID=A0A1S7LEM0_MAGMO|nr:hydrogenase nickel incorporation protein hypA [Candidatus Magnetococcus massalia]